MNPVLTTKYALKGIWLLLVGVVLVSIIAFGAYQYTMRHGFKVLWFEREGEIAKIERLEGEIGAILRGQDEAERMQRAVNDAKEQAYKDISERIDDEQSRAQNDALVVADRFIAANRVRCPSVGGAAREALGPAQGDGARVPEAVPADRLVAVDDADVRACTAATTYAVKAHEWARDLDATNSQ